MAFDFEFFIETLPKVFKGVPVSFAVLIVSFIIGLPLGFLLAVARFRKVKVVGPISSLYVSFMRGAPLIALIYFTYNLVPTLLSSLVRKMGWEFDVFGINPIIYAFIIIGLNVAALSSEVFRAGLVSVDKGQMEAAQAMGLTTWQAYRRIIIPQALVNALPNLCNLTVGTFKGTSLVFVMGVQDITAIAKSEAGLSYAYFEAYLDTFIVYLVFILIIDWLFRLAERNLKKYKAVKA